MLTCPNKLGASIRVNNKTIPLIAEFTNTLEDGTLEKATCLHKTQILGEICEELLKWKARGFKKWITTNQNEEKHCGQGNLKNAASILKYMPWN